MSDCHLKDCGAYAVYVADPKAIRDHAMLKKMDERSKRDGAVERPYVKLTLDNSLLCELAKVRKATHSCDMCPPQISCACLLLH